MHVEQWEKGKIIQRIVVTIFHIPKEFDERDVTNIDSTLEYRPQGCWFILTQKMQGQTSIIEVFTREMRYSFKFPELLTLKSIWDYSEDDSSNDIYGFYVDTLVKNRIDLYIMYSNCHMRKFSSPINSINLQFEEHPHIYNLSSAFKGILDSSGEAGSKRLNLFEQYRGDIFVANSILYSQQGVIDLSILHFQDKFQIGNVLPDKHHIKSLNYIQKFTYSHNEAKLAAFYKAGQAEGYGYGSNYNTILIVTPLYNTRQIPQFPHRAFKHPVVPIVDKVQGCSSVFTLNLGTDYHSWGTYWYGHAYQRKKMWNKLVNINPGFIIKYFNGIEQQVPLYLYGEEFTEIIRFKQSLDGKFILIVGTRKGKLEDRFYDQNILKQQGDLQNGMFLYKVTNLVDITLVKAFLFAVKNPYTYSEEVLKKLSLPATQILELVPSEIAGPQIGEYSYDYLDSDGRQEYPSYDDNIDFKQTDEQYVDELKHKKEQEEIKKQQELELQMRKNRNSTNNRSSSNPKLTNRASLIQSLGGEEEHLHQDENRNHENNEGQEEQKPSDQEFANIARLDDLNILFPGLDIPYLARLPDWQQSFLQIQYDAVTSRKYDAPSDPNIPEDAERFTYEYLKRTAKVFSDEQVEKIQKIHQNMHLEVNENGHVFLINRLNNKLYFFYECNGEHKVTSLKFEPEFVIKTADSSSKYLIVTAIENIEGQSTSKHRFRVLNIQKMLNCENHNTRFTLPELEVVFDSKTFETQGINKEAIGNDEYSYVIDDCKIYDDTIILKNTDNSGVHYLRVYDITKRMLTFYIEGKRFLLSGDKRYVWIMETNEVYDIINGLSTFFMWPGDQINTHSYDHMDAFNVSDDRTIMSTQGYLQLAFTYLSLIIDDELSAMNFKQTDSFFIRGNNLQYLYYKISDFKSILEKIFMEDYDKMSYNKFQYNDDSAGSNDNQEVDEKKKIEQLTNREISQSKQISNLLTYLSEFYDSEKQNPAQISNFFLSFYFLDKNQLGTEKEPVYQNIFEKLFNNKYDKRGDLIEDILNYVVHCSTIPITQYVINSCFTEFLQNANSSQSFQYYLNNITLKTTKMQEIEKFQIASTEQGFIVQSYNSPIMDDKFHTQFRQVKETKKDAEISYINLGNLLMEHGQDIMEMLSDKKYLAIMDIPFIRYFVMYQWFNIKNTIHKKLLIPFICLLTLFTFYATNINFSDTEEIPEELDAPQIIKLVVTWINFFLLMGVLIYFFYIESKQFLKDPTDYFGDFWNISDLLSYFLCLVVIILDRANVPASFNRPIASLCLIILWIKMFYFLRVFESTSKLIRMIIEIVNDMKNFLIVMVIGIIGFSGGFYILQQAVVEDQPMANYIMSIIYTYRLAQGDFDLDFIGSLAGVDYFLGWLLFIMGSLFLVIVLLNLLIAIMGDTFSRVLESITNLTVREKVMLISENEALFERNQLFSAAQFLIVINEKNLDSVQSENWDGQINALRRQVLDKVSALQTNLDFKITENQKDLKKRIMDQEEKQRKAGAMQEQRIQSTVKQEFVEAFTKIQEQFNIQQTSMKSNQTIAHEQMRTMRMLQDQIEQLRNEQSKLSQFVQKAVGKSDQNDEE